MSSDSFDQRISALEERASLHAVRTESLEQRLAAFESTWSSFKRALRDGFLMVAKWVEKNGEQ